MNTKDKLKCIIDRVNDTPDGAVDGYVDINSRGLMGDSLLHFVAVWGDIDSAKILIDAGISIDLQGEHGYTPLLEAIEQGHFKFVEFLLGHKPILKESTVGNELQYAKDSGLDEVVKMLSEYLDLNPKNIDHTPFDEKKHDWVSKNNKITQGITENISRMEDE